MAAAFPYPAYADGEFYPEIRELLAPEYWGLTDAELEALVENVFPALSPGELENFVGTVRDFGRAVVPYVQKVLPGAVQGAVAGTPFGVPGIAIGALAGGATGALKPGLPAAPTAPVAPAAPAAATKPVVQPPTGAGPPATTSPAVTALVGTLLNPAVLDALLKAALGTAGGGATSVAGKAVPAPEILNMLAQLIASALQAYRVRTPTLGEAVPEYLIDERGNFVGDIANPVERAIALYELIQNTTAWDASDYPDEEVDEEYYEAYLDEIEEEGYWR